MDYYLIRNLEGVWCKRCGKIHRYWTTDCKLRIIALPRGNRFTGAFPIGTTTALVLTKLHLGAKEYVPYEVLQKPLDKLADNSDNESAETSQSEEPTERGETNGEDSAVDE